MSETTGQNVVSLLEEHVDHAISTVNTLRKQKIELEAQVSRLSSDVIERDSKIVELETLITEMKEDSELARLATEDERSEIRRQLEGLMQGLDEPDGNESGTEEITEESENEVMFKRNSDE